jgi:hypothetical protein
MNSSPNLSALSLPHKILTTDDTQETRNSSLSFSKLQLEFEHRGRLGCRNEEAARQQGSLFFKGE